MIQESTFNAVYPLAQNLAKKGICVTAIASTPLDQLIQAGHMPMPDRGMDIGDIPTEERIYFGSRSKNAMGEVEHDLAMDEIVETVSKTVTHNLDMARNTINPIVKEVANDVSEYIGNAEGVYKNHLSVVPVFYHAIWDSPILADMVNRFSETPVKEIPLNLTIPGPTTQDELENLAKTGSSRFDGELEDFFTTLAQSQAHDIYETVFGNHPDPQIQKLNDFVRVIDVMSNPDMPKRALLVHLFARKLLVDVPEGVQTDLATYREFLTDILAQSGRVIYGIMQRREQAIRSQKLVTVWPVGPGLVGERDIVIRVNGDVYNKWLDAGGKPEVIMGSFITDQATGYQALLDNADRYAKEWEVKQRVLGTGARLNRFNHAVEGMRQAMTYQINNLDDDVLIVERAVLHRKLQDTLKLLKGKFYDDMFVNARKIVCATLFPHTMGLDILEAIDRVSDDYPDIEIREAALLATIEIVAEWVSKLCTTQQYTV